MIKVGPFTYNIIIEEGAALNDSPASGYIDYDKSEIHIEKELSEDCRKTTLIHELIHAILFCSGIDDSNKEIHKVIDIISIGILDILIRNKQLLNYLIKNSEKGD